MRFLSARLLARSIPPELVVERAPILVERSSATLLFPSDELEVVGPENLVVWSSSSINSSSSSCRGFRTRSPVNMLLTVANAMLVLRTRLGKLSLPVLAVELVAGGEGKPLPPGSIPDVDVWS
jgi:hypothetical protein